jgi:hypothetical protein
MKIVKALNFLIILLIAMLYCSPSAWSTLMADVTYLERKLDDDLWEYQYVITNTSENVDAYLWYFDFNAKVSSASPIEFNPYRKPENWIVNPGYLTELDLTGELIWSYTLSSVGLVPGPIAPGQTESNFIFRFNKQIGNIEFSALFIDEVGNSLPDQYTGFTSPVPEPATILMLVSGMLGLGIFGRKKIRK